MNVRSTCVAVLPLLVLAVGACSGSSSNNADGGAPDGGTSDAGTSDGDASDGGACTPPTGYEQVAPLAAGAKQDDAHVAMVTDAAGNPMLAWVAYEATATNLYFQAYDPSACTWKPVVLVDTVGDVDYTRDREVTMARDPASGHLAIGYQTISQGDTKVMLAQSDDGAAWTKETVDERTPNQSGSVHRPTVAMKDGKTYLAYYVDYLFTTSGSSPSDSSGYKLGVRTGTSGAFSYTNVPAVGDNGLPGNEPFPASIAIDAAGNAGLAFFAHTSDTIPDSYNLRVDYFSTATGKTVAVFDSENTQNDAADVSLAFEGTKPRIAASLSRGTTIDTDSNVWFSASDDGATWSKAVEVPKDQGDTMGADIALAADGKGTLSIATNRSGGTGDRTCGPPKISTSSDDGKTWATCGPTLASATAASIDYAGGYVQLAYTASGKRISAFSVPNSGLYVWREP